LAVNVVVFGLSVLRVPLVMCFSFLYFDTIAFVVFLSLWSQYVVPVLKCCSLTDRLILTGNCIAA